MRSVRLNVFETNSSATHAVSISGQYATVEDIPNRDPSTLPALDEDGNLVIELTTYWDSGDSVYDLDLNDPGMIIEYLAAQVVFSDKETIYSRKNHETRETYDENIVNFLNVIQEAYRKLGLEEPKGFKTFFRTDKGEKFFITPENHDDFYPGYDDNSWYDSYEDFCESIKEDRDKHPERENWPIAKYRIGVATNDLISSSFANACDHFYAESNHISDLSLTAVDIIVKDVTLYFYHT